MTCTFGFLHAMQVALQLVFFAWIAFMLWVLVTIALVTVDRGVQHGLTVSWGHPEVGDHPSSLDLIESGPTAEDRITTMYTFMTYYKVK